LKLQGALQQFTFVFMIMYRGCKLDESFNHTASSDCDHFTNRPIRYACKYCDNLPFACGRVCYWSHHTL